jgi:hypothetical protein
MQVRTSLRHLCGKKIQVGTTHYDVNEQGIIEAPSDEHAQELLGHANNAWVEHNPKDTGKAMPKRRAVSKPIFTRAADAADYDGPGMPGIPVGAEGAENISRAGIPAVDQDLVPEPTAAEVNDPNTGAKTKRQRS